MTANSKIIAAWNRFFFEPIPAYSLALFRIAFAFVVLVILGLLAPDALDRYGPRGVLPAADAANTLAPPRINLLLMLPQSDAVVYGFFAFSFLATLALLVGFRTRIASILVWVCVISLHHRNVYLLNAGDHLVRNLSFLLMFAPAGACFSVDRWLRRRRGIEPAGQPMIVPWAQRLLQLQLCIMYADSVMWKLAGNHWLDGTAVYYIVQLDEFRRFPVPAWCATLWFSRFATWSSLAAEAAMATLVWIRPLRRYVLCAGIALHLGLEYTMNIPVFQWVVLASYCLFLDDTTWRPKRTAAQSPPAKSSEMPSSGPAHHSRRERRSTVRKAVGSAV